MFSLTGSIRYWVCRRTVDMRNGINGLMAIVEGEFGLRSTSGDAYVFFSKDRRTMKALRWDGDGFLMYTKRLSQGRFREVLRKGDDGVRRLQWDDFYMLMRGLTPVKVVVESRFRMAVK